MLPDAGLPEDLRDWYAAAAPVATGNPEHHAERTATQPPIFPGFYVYLLSKQRILRVGRHPPHLPQVTNGAAAGSSTDPPQGQTRKAEKQDTENDEEEVEVDWWQIAHGVDHLAKAERAAELAA